MHPTFDAPDHQNGHLIVVILMKPIMGVNDHLQSGWFGSFLIHLPLGLDSGALRLLQHEGHVLGCCGTGRAVFFFLGGIFFQAPFTT